MNGRSATQVDFHCHRQVLCFLALPGSSSLRSRTTRSAAPVEQANSHSSQTRPCNTPNRCESICALKPSQLSPPSPRLLWIETHRKRLRGWPGGTETCTHGARHFASTIGEAPTLRWPCKGAVHMQLAVWVQLASPDPGGSLSASLSCRQLMGPAFASPVVGRGHGGASGGMFCLIL